MKKDYSMKPKRQVQSGGNTKTTDVMSFATKLVVITPMKDEDGDYLRLSRYQGKEKKGEAILQDCTIPEEARRLVEEFRTLK